MLSESKKAIREALKFAAEHKAALQIITIAFCSFIVLSYFDAFEKFVSFSKKYESFELDEFAMLAIIMTVAASLIAVRRSRDLQKEMVHRWEAEQQAEQLALNDPLTGLANRRHFVEELDRFAEAARSGGMTMTAMVIDLDGFKPVNDVHGHAAGDAVLQQVAMRIIEEVRVGDLAARIGGDEFAILANWDSANPVPVTKMANRIRASLARPYLLHNTQVELSASIGVAALRDNEPSELMHNADVAMYKAKRSGRNRVAHFDKALSREMRRRAELEQQIRRGVRDDEFVPFFHPLVDLETGKDCGFEVLARWLHPQEGLTAPDLFVPIAEEFGLIGDIGWMVLEKACLAAKQWPAPLPISFNLSPNQFQDRRLAAKICAILEATDFPGERLEVEVTESGVIQDVTLAKGTIEELKKRKVSVALEVRNIRAITLVFHNVVMTNGGIK